jgi:hypothetical protein
VESDGREAQLNKVNIKNPPCSTFITNSLNSIISLFVNVRYIVFTYDGETVILFTSRGTVRTSVQSPMSIFFTIKAQTKLTTKPPHQNSLELIFVRTLMESNKQIYTPKIEALLKVRS